MFIGLKPRAERGKRQQQIMAEVRKRFGLIPGLKGNRRGGLAYWGRSKNGPDPV